MRPKHLTQGAKQNCGLWGKKRNVLPKAAYPGRNRADDRSSICFSVETYSRSK